VRESAEQPSSRWQTWGPWACLALIIAVGAGFRLGYFLNGDPFVDEWATILVAQGIWERGLPFLPSGSFYGHGMLFSYLDALFLALLGWTPVVAQLPSLIAGLVTIPLAYLVGRQLFSSVSPSGAEGRLIPRWRGEAVGLLAAALLALDPIAIIWAGRARAYTLLQVFVLLAILWLYRRRFLLFAAAFVAAVFSHAEASLLLPGFALGLLLVNGWSVLRRPRVWLVMGISGASIVARLLIHYLIATDSSRQFPEIATRPAFQPTLDVVAGFEPLLPYFAEPYRLLVTVLFLVGLIFAIRAWRRQERSSGYLFLYPLCLVTLAGILLLVGQTWKDPRYLFMLLPAFFILAGAALVDLLILASERLDVPVWLKVAGAVVLIAVLLIPPLPEALDTADKLEEGYGPALAYVREQRQAGDQVAGWAVPAIAVELGQIDYFAIQIRHEEFIMQKDGVWVDRWVGAPLLDSVEQLQTALDEPGRLWFLTDEFRFRARYTPEFAQAVWDRMDPVYRYHYALAFVERPVEAPSYNRDLHASFDRGLDLDGYDLDPATLEPGDTLTLTLHWQARDWVDAPYTTFVHLLDPDGQGVTQADGPPFNNLHPTDHWLPGERLRDQRRLTVPQDAPPGRYQLVVGWYDPLTLERLPLVDGGDALLLAYVPVGQIEVDEPANGVHATLGGQVELVGFDLWREQDGQWLSLPEGEPIAAGDRMKTRLVWRALAEVDQDYTAFVHLRGSDGALWAQHDEQPQGGVYPTSYWRQGELVADEHEFVAAEGVAGTAELSAGMYLLETMERLGEAVFLQQIEVRP
jgi:4-amino-4-deoxy-L-arabinose transferase-like glycosyltransferase